MDTLTFYLLSIKTIWCFKFSIHWEISCSHEFPIQRILYASLVCKTFPTVSCYRNIFCQCVTSLKSLLQNCKICHRREQIFYIKVVYKKTSSLDSPNFTLIA